MSDSNTNDGSHKISANDPRPDVALANIPLFVDVDGTLTRSDISIENALHFARKSLFNLIKVMFWFFAGKAIFKAMVARYNPVNAAILPYRKEVLSAIDEAKKQGRTIILASASHRRNIIRIAKHIGLSSPVIATHKNFNCKGADKLSAIQDYHDGPFDYIGDSRADIVIWQAAK